MAKVMTAQTSTDLPEKVAELAAIPFDRLPSEVMIRAFGVYYGHIRTADGGDLFATRYGWPFLRQLLPESWYANEWYSQQGEKLPGSTGHVYRVPTRPVAGRSIDLVVKFSRVGQEVPLVVAQSALDTVSHEEVVNARFNSPLEEFGLVMEMRRGAYGPRRLRINSQRPLAIYAPPEQFELWQLGRTHSRFRAHQNRLAVDQERADAAMELDIKRDYVLLFNYIKGIDAENAHLADEITEEDLHSLTERVTEELKLKGFRVLDNKPKHYIVRHRGPDRCLLRKQGELVYGLVDFELLERTREYDRHFRMAQRAKYWQMQSHRMDRPPAWLPPHLKRMSIFGVNYLYGTTPNSGKVWAVGNDPDLFDYFLPDRWRRTPRLRLAIADDIYRTRTRDNIHLVYRRSRVGERPQVDPIHVSGQRIRQHGYNSPFEEIAVAELLRRHGISTIYPRAIYRTGHESLKTVGTRDDRRYHSHADLTTPKPESEPILSSHHEFYTIWGYFRGISPQKDYRRHGHWGFVDLEKALEDEVLDEKQFHEVVDATRSRLNAIGFPEETIEDFEFLLRFDHNGVLIPDDQGRLDVTWSLDALAAHEYGLIDEVNYRHLVERTRSRLEAANCEALDLSGRHLLLSLNPDGKIKPDDQGEIDVTLCNLELIRGISCMM